MDFDLVTRAHVERAIERLRSGEIVQGYGASTEYDIIVDGRAYAPKQVMALACQEATGSLPSAAHFSGGVGTPCFRRLAELGYPARAKGAPSDPVLDKGLFALLGELSRKKRAWTELSLEQQAILSKTHGDLDVFARDFVARHWTDMPLSYHLSRLQNQAGNASDSLFVAFYGKRNPLYQMSIQFLVLVDGNGIEIGLSMGSLEETGSDFDLRSIHYELNAEMLQMPTEIMQVLAENLTPNYQMFLDGERSQPAASLEEWFWKAGTSPFARITRILDPGILDSKSTRALADGTGPDPSSLVPAADKAFEIFLPTLRHLSTMTPEDNSAPSTWIFQGNPKLFRMDDYLSSREEFSWTVNQNRDRIRKGDRVYIWRAGSDSGIVAVAEAIGDVAEQPDDFSDYWLSAPVDNSKRDRVRLRMLDCRVIRPLTRDTLRRHVPDLTILSAPQMTNYYVKPEQAEKIAKLLDGLPSAPPENPPFTIDAGPASFTRADLLRGLFMPEEKVDAMLRTLRARRNLVLQGPPGVGKTFVARSLAYCHMGAKDKERVKLVQFHQSYSYEDFVEGIRPDGKGGFGVRDGVFKAFCDAAALRKDEEHVFIIDEINRGNLSKILGELMMLLEHDKRGPDHEVLLTYSQRRFHVPQNVRVIGMMNTADRSLALVDYALRRRFSFVDVTPGFGSSKFADHLKGNGIHPDRTGQIVDAMNELNATIAASPELGDGFMVGHSYFCAKPADVDYRRWLTDVLELEIHPLLREYWFDNKTSLDAAWKKLSSRLLG